MKEREQQEVLLAEGSVDTLSCSSLATNNRPTSCPLLPAITSKMVLSENDEGRTNSMRSLNGKNDASDDEYQTALPRHVRASDVVSRWSNKGSCPLKYTYKRSRKKRIEGPHSRQTSLDTTIAAEQNGREEVTEPFKESSLLEDAVPQAKQKPDRTSGDTLNLNEVIDPMLSLTVPGGSESVHYGSRHMVGECLPAIIKSTCQGNRNADVLTDNVVVEAAQSNHLMETPMLSVDCLVQQDGGHVNERSPQLWLQNAGSSPCTTENGVLESSSVSGNSQCTSEGGVLRSCFVAGSSMPQDMSLPQVSGHQVPFIKSSPFWPLFEEMDVFKMIPQRPHFHALREHARGLREGMAIGLMVTFGNLMAAMGKSSISDSVESFEEKMSALRYLEDNGFNVQSLRCNLIKLSQIKADNLKHLKQRDDLRAQILEKKTLLSRTDLLLDEYNKVLAEQEKRLRNFRSMVQQIAKEREHEEEELSSLESAHIMAEEACGDDERQFRITFSRV